MAHRIHVVALRNTTVDAVRDALAPWGRIEVKTANGWCWFSAPVWHVGADQILDKLQDFDGPLLLVTTEDACRWYLQLRKKGGASYVAVHEFPPCGQDDGALDWDDLDDFEEEDEGKACEVLTLGMPPIPASDLPALAFRDAFFEPYLDDGEEDIEAGREYDESPLGQLREAYASLGLPLPETIIARLRELPEEEVGEAFRVLHAEDIQQALEHFAIPHDRRTVLDILRGKTVTPVEMDWDIGNLPRFLAALGLGPHFEKMVADAEREARQLAELESEDFARSVVEAMRGVVFVSLAGGAVAIPITDAPLLFRAGYYTNVDMEGAFEARLPGRASFTPSERVPNYLSIAEADGKVLIGVSNSDVFLVEASSAKLGGMLGALPGGTELILHMASKTVPCQQFRGFIRDGQWWVESSVPPLPAESLPRAMDVFRAARSKVPLMAASDGEARVILAAAKTDVMLCDAPPTREGLALVADRPYQDDLAALFFQHRFGDLWDCSAQVAEDRRRFDVWRQFEKEMAEAEQLPVKDRVILEGRASRFLEADMKAAARDKELAEGIRKLPVVLKALSALGFEHLGDLVCEKVGKCVICAFANPGEPAFAAHYVVPFGVTWEDCFTPFDDGTSLTTATGMLEGSIARLRILQHPCESGSPEELLAAHRTGMDILRKHGIEKVRIQPTLEGFARAMDEYLVKRLAAE